MTSRDEPRDIWGSGQDMGAIDEILPTAALIDRFAADYRDALTRNLALAG